MTIRMSPNIAIRHRDFKAAMSFYSLVLGLENRSTDPALGDFDADPINLFVIEDEEIEGPVMELFVDDLDEARTYFDPTAVKSCAGGEGAGTVTSAIPSASDSISGRVRGSKI